MARDKKSEIDMNKQEQIDNEAASSTNDVDVNEDHCSEEDNLRKEVVTLEEKLLLSIADHDNYKKRTARRFEDILRSANDKLLFDFLEISDNLERALVHANGDSNSGDIRRGTELIAKQLGDLLSRNQVKEIDALGKKFDATRHEALMTVASDEHPEGTVALEMTKGYMKDDRVLRYSKVAVSKGPESKDEEKKETEIKEY